MVAYYRIEARDGIRLVPRATASIAQGERTPEGHGRFQFHRAVKRIKHIDRLQLDEALLLLGARHGPDLNRARQNIAFGNRSKHGRENGSESGRERVCKDVEMSGDTGTVQNKEEDKEGRNQNTNKTRSTEKR